MRILHVLNDSAPEIDGYSMRSAAIVRGQRDALLSPIVVTSPRHGSATATVEDIGGIRHYRTPHVALPPVPFVRELREMSRLRRRIEAVARMERVDVIHAHSPSLWGHAGLRAARRLRLPFVYEVRALWEDAAVADARVKVGSLRYRLSRALETRLLRAADGVVVICKGLQREVCTRGLAEAEVAIVPNGVDVDAFQPRPRDEPLAADLGVEADCPVIGYVGSLRTWEGVDTLVHVAPVLVRRFPRLRFLIVGGGEQRAALAAAIRDAGIAPHVRLVGAVAPHEVGRYYSLLDIAVFPRRRCRLTEMTTPLKPLEAMAMGKAVVISDVGGLRELVTDGAARPYSAGDVADLARVCSELVGDAELRDSLGAEARRLAQGHTWASATRAYGDIYAAAARKASKEHR